MSARDELATLIESGYAGDDSDCPYEHAPSIADAILAAGYTKPRTITTAEELDALPAGSVILDDDESAAVKVEADRWELSGFSSTFRTDAIDLPAAVLYEPAP